MLASWTTPRTTRRSVRETLDGSALSDQAVNDAVLMIDELVTNAVVHAGTPVVVVLELTPSGYRCEVVDQGVDGPLPRLVDVTAGAGQRPALRRVHGDRVGRRPVRARHDGLGGRHRGGVSPVPADRGARGPVSRRSRGRDR